MSAEGTLLPQTGSLGTRLRDPLVVGLFAGAFLSLLALMVAVVQLRVGQPAAPCPRAGPCTPPYGSPPLVAGRMWRSSGLDVQLEYDDTAWRALRDESRTLELGQAGARLLVEVQPAGDAAALLRARAEQWRRDVPDLAPNDEHRQPLGANIGYHDGAGSAYCGSPPNPVAATPSVDIVVLAASDGLAAVVVSVITDDCAKPAASSRVLAHADTVLNTVRWPSDPAPGG